MDIPVLFRVILQWVKHHDQNQPREEWVYFFLQPAGNAASLRNIKAG